MTGHIGVPVPVERLDHASPEVAEEIRSLMAASYEVEARLLQVADFFPLRRTAAHIAEERAEFLGVREAGALVAAAELEDPEPGHAHIGAMVVRPSEFRRGLASAMLRAIVAARPAHAITVSTGERNAPAIALYERHGFAVRERWTTPDGIPMVTLALGTAD